MDSKFEDKPKVLGSIDRPDNQVESKGGTEDSGRSGGECVRSFKQWKELGEESACREGVVVTLKNGRY